MSNDYFGFLSWLEFNDLKVVYHACLRVDSEKGTDISGTFLFAYKCELKEKSDMGIRSWSEFRKRVPLRNIHYRKFDTEKNILLCEFSLQDYFDKLDSQNV